MYRTVNKKKKAPDQPNREFIQTELSKSTFAGINTNKEYIPSDATISTTHAAWQKWSKILYIILTNSYKYFFKEQMPVYE